MNGMGGEENRFSRYNMAFYNRAILKRIDELKFESIEGYMEFFRKDDGEKDILNDSLRISYSEFFRNPLTCAVLERLLLPLVITKKTNARRNEMRIWSASCAGGQEPYTLAILLEEQRKKISSGLTYRIFATDIAADALAEAKNGLYEYSDVKNVSLTRLDEWFERRALQYEVKPVLKERIEFSEFDLFSENASCPPGSIFGDFDLVVCANVLFYYTKEYQDKILEKASLCLAPDGFLMTGETEREIVMNNGWAEVYPQSAIFKLRSRGRKKT